MKHKVSIKLVWYGLIGLITLLPMVILLPWIGSKTHSLLLENALLREAEFNKQISDTIEHEVKRMITLLGNKTNPMAVSMERIINRNYLDELLGKVLKREPAIASLYVLRPDKMIIAGLMRSEDDDFYDLGSKYLGTSDNAELSGSPPSVAIPMEGRNYIEASHIHRGRPYFHISIPIGSRKSPMAILMAELDIELLWHSLESRLARPHVTTYLIDRRGNLLSRLTKTKYKPGDLLTEFKIVRSVLARTEWIKNGVYVGLTGTPVFGTATHIDLVNWGVVSEVPEKNITIPIVETLLSMAAIVFGVITLFSIVGFWLVSRVTKPITELTDVFDHVTNGDYSGSIHPSPIKEIDTIVKHCNGMVAEINDKECQREDLISVLEESNIELERSEDKLRETLKRMDMAYEQSMIYAKELAEEVSERKKSEDIVRHMAYHDQLTGLPNRILLNDRLDQMLAEERRYKKLGAVLFLDLDNFKVINDTMGHSEGDELLKAVAKRLKKHVRDSDTLARHGGDEFTILMHDINKVENVTKVIESVFSEFNEPFRLKGKEIFVTTSIGISIYPNDGEDADALLKNADIAMYKAKEDGKNTYQLFDPTMNEKALERVVLESKLRKAIENKDFILHYQPQIDINTGETVGLESLLSWEEKEIGLIPPGQFIPLAEDTGLIVPIGEWVLHTACLQNRLWQDKGLKPVDIAVNVSLRQFKQNNFVDDVRRILTDTNLNPQYLELEITESSIMEDVASNIELLRELKSIGLKLSIDDFGTGYSSFEYLKLLPVDILKIDLSFIRDITENADDAAITKAIIQVAHTLKLEVVAEGVETTDQFRLLEQLQCDKIQGYLVAKPAAPSEAFERRLTKEWHFIVDETYSKGHEQPNVFI